MPRIWPTGPRQEYIHDVATIRIPGNLLAGPRSNFFLFVSSPIMRNNYSCSAGLELDPTVRRYAVPWSSCSLKIDRNISEMQVDLHSWISYRSTLIHPVSVTANVSWFYLVNRKVVKDSKARNSLERLHSRRERREIPVVSPTSIDVSR